VDQIYRFFALIGRLLLESIAWWKSCSPWNGKRIQIIISFWKIHRLSRILSFLEYKYLVKIYWIWIKKRELRIDESYLLYGFVDSSYWIRYNSKKVSQIPYNYNYFFWYRYLGILDTHFEQIFENCTLGDEISQKIDN